MMEINPVPQSKGNVHLAEKVYKALSLSPIYENESDLKIYHRCDLKNLLQVASTDELINTSLS